MGDEMGREFAFISRGTGWDGKSGQDADRTDEQSADIPLSPFRVGGKAAKIYHIIQSKFCFHLSEELSRQGNI